ncbi:hypothetical protein VCRA2110O2_30035 [Vibrio crassostreae]|nr:hypothetical protein VCRA2110O2_30035 [Vibrio crassostreae]
MDSPVSEGDHQGYLPDDLREVIGEHICMEYQPESVITMLLDRALRENFRTTVRTKPRMTRLCCF